MLDMKWSPKKQKYPRQSSTAYLDVSLVQEILQLHEFFVERVLPLLMKWLQVKKKNMKTCKRRTR